MASASPSTSSSSSQLPPQSAALLRASLARVEELWQAEETIIATRAIKRKGKREEAGGAGPSTSNPGGTTRACQNCRKAKCRCLPGEKDDGKCVRCSSQAVECVYPEEKRKGPRKRLSKTQRDLQLIRRNLEAVLSGTATLDPLEEAGSDEDIAVESAETWQPDEQDAATMLRNPLAVLAQASEQAEASASPVYARPDYYSEGLYQPRPETDMSLDPVESGLLTMEDLRRLVNLYFDSLRPFSYLLIRELHTLEFLRLNSPFLTTTLAFVASTFDLNSAHFCQALGQHARRLATHALDAGLRSLEIAQGFFLLSHWASPSDAWADDRSWQFVGFAHRMISNLRLDLPLDPNSLSYRTTELYDAASLDLHRRNRELTVAVLFCCEIAMSVQTGRLDILQAPPTPPSAYSTPFSLPHELPEPNYAANLALNAMLVRASTLAASARQDPKSKLTRAEYVSGWKREHEEWRATWSGFINPFIDIRAENNVILLSLISLRFKDGPAAEILEEVKAAAVRTVEKVSSWEDRFAQLPYASNFLIVNAAYSSILLLQLSQRSEQGVGSELRNQILRVVNVLETVGRERPNAPSIATLHAQRLRNLVESNRDALSPPNPDDDTPPLQLYSELRPPTFPLPPPPSSSVPHPPQMGMSINSLADLPTLAATPLPSLLPSAAASPAPDFSLDGAGDGTAGWGFPAPTPSALDHFLDMTTQDPMMSWLWEPGELGGFGGGGGGGGGFDAGGEGGL
ncbi:hypothetical protein JCM8547_003729 [Rhodosporidiobolus lusitaniae]